MAFRSGKRDNDRARALTNPADDGIIDLIAVEIAALGIRAAALTPAERRLAAARILARSGSLSMVCERLHPSGSIALALATQRQGPAVSYTTEMSQAADAAKEADR